MRNARKVLVAVMCLSLARCYSTYDVTPRMVPALDGFHESAARKIDGVYGEVTFDRETELRFELPEQTVAGRFSSIAVNDSIFRGIDRRSHAPLVVDLGRAERVTARKFSVGKTVALTVVASVLGTIAVGVLAVWIGLATATDPL